MSLTPPPVNREPFQQLPDGRFVVDEQWHAFFRDMLELLNTGVTLQVPLAKTTPGGADGLLTIRNGVVVQATLPT